MPEIRLRPGRVGLDIPGNSLMDRTVSSMINTRGPQGTAQILRDSKALLGGSDPTKSGATTDEPPEPPALVSGVLAAHADMLADHEGRLAALGDRVSALEGPSVEGVA
jgi:hypothetical protein